MRSSVRGAPAVEARQRRAEIQRVLHVAGGMLRRHVQRIEAVPFVFDLRAFDDREPHAREDLLQTVADGRQGMAMAELAARGPAA